MAPKHSVLGSKGIIWVESKHTRESMNDTQEKMIRIKRHSYDQGFLQS